MGKTRFTVQTDQADKSEKQDSLGRSTWYYDGSARNPGQIDKDVTERREGDKKDKNSVPDSFCLRKNRS